jgi:branched-chain amino acid transport system ATP-binding protein
LNPSSSLKTPARARSTAAELLSVRDLHASYGAIKVLHGVDVDVSVGGATAVLGANGAGKTTLLRAICGMIQRQGIIELAGEAIDKLDTADIARRGVAHVPQGRGTFTSLTAEENLQLGAYSRRKSPKIEQDYALVYEYFPRLYERRHQQAGTLSGGEQQMLAIGRALMLEPKLLVLDEPSFGLAPRITQEIFAIMRKINRERQVSILLVEQNANLALEFADRVCVLETGVVVSQGTPDDMRQNQEIQRAYLGY